MKPNKAKPTGAHCHVFVMKVTSWETRKITLFSLLSLFAKRQPDGLSISIKR